MIIDGNQVTINTDDQVTVTSGDGTPSWVPLPTLPPLPALPPFPTFPPLPTLTPYSPPADPAAGEATFHLTGGPDPQTEQAIAQLINGRNFRARLVSRQDGTADLTITVLPQPAGSVTGRQSVSLTTSAGSTSGGTAQKVSIQIVTENGITHVSIGAGR